MQIAPQIICELQRQQTRLLVDYLQVLLNTIDKSLQSLTKPQLATLDFTCQSLSRFSQPADSPTQSSKDTQVALSSFTLQVMLQQTLSHPLKQHNEFHRSPDFNVPQPSVNRGQSTAATAVVQRAMHWLNMTGIRSTAQIDAMLLSLRQPCESSQLPEPDDADFLQPSDVEV